MARVSPKTAAQTLGPLRHVITEGSNEHGVEVETLECGHTIHRKSDIVGPTNAFRRRCRHCRDGHVISIFDLSDEPLGIGKHSPRLYAFTLRMPPRARFALCNENVHTLAQLCTKTCSDMLRCHNVGKKAIADIEVALASVGLALANEPEKPQTPGQRVANSVWLREQIRALIKDCDENIAEDQALADKERDDVRRARYEASVDCHRHWRRQLARILAGKTSIEDLADTLIQQGVQP